MIPYINMTNPNIPNVGIRGVRNVNVRMANLRKLDIPETYMSVSYTHLTLPTKA